MRVFRIREEVLHPERLQGRDRGNSQRKQTEETVRGDRQRKQTEETEDVYLNRIDR